MNNEYGAPFIITVKAGSDKSIDAFCKKVSKICPGCDIRFAGLPEASHRPFIAVIRNSQRPIVDEYGVFDEQALDMALARGEIRSEFDDDEKTYRFDIPPP